MFKPCHLLSLLVLCSSPLMAQTLGDINGDRQVTQADITALDNYLKGSGLLTDSQTRQADFNGDGTVDARDQELLRQQLTPAPQAAAPTQAANPDETADADLGTPVQNTKIKQDQVLWSHEDTWRAWSAEAFPLRVYMEDIPETMQDAKNVQRDYSKAIDDAITSWNKVGIQGKTVFERTDKPEEAQVSITWKAEEPKSAAGTATPQVQGFLKTNSLFAEIVHTNITLWTLIRKKRVIPTSLLGFFLPIPAMDIPLENVETRPGGDLHGIVVHELGHALGLEHNNNPKDVMYPQESPGGFILLGLEFHPGQGLTQATIDRLGVQYAMAWNKNFRPTTLNNSSVRPAAVLLRPNGLVDAAALGKTDQVEQLLSQGTNIDAQDEQGWTALIAAASEGQTAMVKFLLAKGADVALKDKHGYTALTYAKSANHPDVTRLLTQARPATP